jgi:peptidoglycan/xylan/chitin deacetylase (PgdA/CDA1 family)
VSATTLTYELQHSKQYLEQITGRPVVNFASPYGDYNMTVTNEVKKYYRSHRSVDEGYNSKDNLNVYNLRVQNVLDTTSAAQVAAWIAQAKVDNTWLILVYHRVATNPGPYDTYTNVFAEHVKTISQSGVVVKTYNDALNEVLAQMP